MYVFGNHDGSQGGQLVLHEARLVINLYPGDIIFFPSACMTHANLPIQGNEIRRSLVCYMAGGILRYAAQGLQTRDAWAATEEGKAEMAIHDAESEERWNAGWAMYSSLRDFGLVDDPSPSD